MFRAFNEQKNEKVIACSVPKYNVSKNLFSKKLSKYPTSIIMVTNYFKVKHSPNKS